MQNGKLVIFDSTLRDGSHAIANSLTPEQVSTYAGLAEQAGIDILEVGHGLGLGASSLQSGFSDHDDSVLIEAALERLNRTKLCCFALPGFATIQRNIVPAMQQGVKIFRLGCHCTEADICPRYIEFLKAAGKTVYISFTMSHMATKEELLRQGLLVQEAGADGLILMDSAGHFLVGSVWETIVFLHEGLKMPLGFHAHNNLSLAVANALISIEQGCTIVDGCSCGFGAASGNTPMEIVVPLLERCGYATGIDVSKLFKLAEYTKNNLVRSTPFSKPLNVMTGLYGLTSAFTSHIERVAREFSIDPLDLCRELAVYKPVGGQEDLIMKAALNLTSNGESATKVA